LKTPVRRLFEQFRPSNYDLQLVIDEAAMTFTGTAIIKGQKTGKPSKRITLHQKGLKIQSAVITHHDKKGAVVKDLARFNNHNTYDEVRLHTVSTLYPGEYTIQVTYSGVITRPMNGMYPCTYQQDGVQKQLIATQFESHHAREVFPCIDEPEAKAVFDISLTTRSGITVLSNTPVKTQTTKAKTMVTTFEPSPVMSTYLVAFVFGDLQSKQAKTKSGVVVSAYATPDNVKLVDFALDTAVRCIDFYEQYFSIPYPLAKCDIIALPDFASGAMENWGCITFREQCMLVDSKNTSVPTKQYVAMVVTHELAHMWFGNLVTMRWWTDLWLNEGFATWVEYMATDALFPEWQMWTQFIVDEQQLAFRLDALENTHPIEVPVMHPDEIRTIFDSISYSKGAAVINQLYAYIGPKAFQDGLNLYLTKHAYKNTVTTDLWAAFSQSSGIDVAAFMNAWTSKPGYPIVHVAEKDDHISLSQKRFYLVQPTGKSKLHSEWQIPLLDDRLGEAAVLGATHTSLKISTKDPLFLNKDRRGFYRVSYEKALLDKLASLVSNGKLNALDRLGLLSDLFEGSKTGDIDTVTAVKFLSHYATENNAAVWDIIAGMIGSIKLILGSDELREAIKLYVRDLCAEEYKRLGWDKKAGEPYFDTLLRPTMLASMASADHPDVVLKCLELFEQAVEKPKDTVMDPDLKGIVYGTAARLGDKTTYNNLLKLYDLVTLSEDKLTICGALTGFKQPALIQDVLKLIKSDRVRLQDVGYWIAYSLMNHFARDKTWQWVKDNWEWLDKNMGTDLSFYRMPIYVARVYSSDEFAKDYVEFFTARMSPSLERSYKQGLEMLEWQTSWRTRDQKTITDYFTGLR
jgi:aminopeptidase N